MRRFSVGAREGDGMIFARSFCALVFERDSPPLAQATCTGDRRTDPVDVHGVILGPLWLTGVPALLDAAATFFRQIRIGSRQSAAFNQEPYKSTWREVRFVI